jgi:hypothetical protein
MDFDLGLSSLCCSCSVPAIDSPEKLLFIIISLMKRVFEEYGEVNPEKLLFIISSLMKRVYEEYGQVIGLSSGFLPTYDVVRQTYDIV